MHRLIGFGGADASNQIALVVAGAASNELVVPDHTGVGWDTPVLQRLRGHDVIVVVHEQRLGGGAWDSAYDKREPTLRVEHADLSADPLQQGGDMLSALDDVLLARRDGGDAAELLQPLDVLVPADID